MASLREAVRNGLLNDAKKRMMEQKLLWLFINNRLKEKFLLINRDKHQRGSKSEMFECCSTCTDYTPKWTALQNRHTFHRQLVNGHDHTTRWSTFVLLSMARSAQKWQISDQKKPNKCSKVGWRWSIIFGNGQHIYFWPFLTTLGPSYHFLTISE